MVVVLRLTMAKGKKRRASNRPPSVSKDKKRLAGLGPSDGHWQARARAIRLASSHPATPLRRTANGWVLEPHGVPPIHFLFGATQFEWPSAAEIAAAGSSARSAGRKLLDVRPNSDAERLLVQTRLAGRQDPKSAAPNTSGTASASVARAVELLRLNGIRALPTRTHIVVIDNVDCRIGHDGEGIVIQPRGAAAVTVHAATTRFAGVTNAELTAVPSLKTPTGATVDAPAGTELEQALFAVRVAPLVLDLNNQKALDRQREVDERAEKVAREAQLEGQLATTVESLAREHVPIALEYGELIYDGFAFGTTSIGADRIVLTVASERRTLVGPESAPRKLADDLGRISRGLRAAAEEFAALGVEPSFSREGLCIDAACVARARNGVPDLIELIGRHGLDELETHVARELQPLLSIPIETSADAAIRSIRLFHESLLLGSVNALTASIGGEVIEGQFTRPSRQGLLGRPSSHWLELASAIERRLAEHQATLRATAEQEARRAERARQHEERLEATQARVVIDEPPALPDELIDVCLEASEDIRLNRTAAFSNPVTLITPGFELTFQPVEAQGASLLVRFTYNRRGRTIEGHLRLSGRKDPLPVVIHGIAPEGDNGRIWAAVLLGFAALTVLPEFVETRRAGTRPAARIYTGGSRARNVRSVTQSRRRYIGQALTPTGWTATAHWVVGHIRVLAPGMQASDSAEREAAKIGISLRSGETWVRPHVRGGSPDRILTFLWSSPPMLVGARIAP